MESIALEEKINKIRLRNEEIKRRYEEVEADKKNAAKLDALIEPIPLEDWPERKEPPEFSDSFGKHAGKTKQSVRRHNDHPSQYHTGSGEGKKTHSFADGQGPPPDPRYNFLADSEREERANEIPKDSERNRGRNKSSRGGFRRRGSGRDWHAKEHWNQHENPGNLTQPEYEAWRAERNRIDEARISRQRTAEGNWRREWDNDKIHLADDVTKRENRVTLGDAVTRQEENENEKHYRSPRGPTRFSPQFNARETHQAFAFSEPIKSHGGVIDNEKRHVITTDKSIKVLLNSQGSTPTRSSVMSVKVSSPNIAGTGRVGPRQRPRVTYSSQSEADSSINENSSMPRQKSIDESTRIRSFDQTHRITPPKSPHHQRKSEGKISYPARRDNAEGATKFSRKDCERFEGTTRSSRRDSQKSPRAQKSANTLNYPPKSPRDHGKSAEFFKNDDFTKLAQAQRENNIGNNLPRKITSASDDSTPTVVSSVPDDKSNYQFDQIEIKDDENEKAHFMAQEIPETTECLRENNEAIFVQAQLERPSCSTGENCLESLECDLTDNATNNENKEKLKLEIGNDEAKYNNSLDDVESSENLALNCSVNSGITSNDSGFIELPSNDSIHDISDNDNVEINKVDENFTESRPSTSQTDENCAIVETHVTQSKLTNNENIDVESSLNNAEIAVDNLQSEIPENVANGPGNNETDDTESEETIESQEKEPVTMEISDEISKITQVSKDSSNDKAPTIESELQENEPVTIEKSEEILKITQVSKNSSNDKAPTIESELQENEPVTIEKSDEISKITQLSKDSSNDKAPTIESELQENELVTMEKPDEISKITQVSKDSSNDEAPTIESQSQENEPVTMEKSDEIPKITQLSKESSNDEEPIVSTSPNDGGQNTDVSVSAETLNPSAHGKDEICNKSLT